MDQAERKDSAQQALVYVGVAVAVVIVLVLLWYAIDVVLLAFIGVLIAILLRAPADWLAERTGMREHWALALVFFFAGAILLTLGALFGRGVMAQALQLIDRIPEIVQTVKQQLGQTDLGAQAVSLVEASGAFAGGESQFLSRGLGLIGTTFGAIANVLIVIFFAAFMAAQPRVYVEGALFLVAKKRRDRVREVLYEIGHVLRRWLVGQSALALVVATVITAGLTFLGAPFPVALGILAGLMEFVPYIGPFVAAVPAILVGFSESPQLALWVGLFFLAVQILESYVLAPLVQQKAVYLPPAVVLFSQVLMGVIVGAVGVAVATPLAAAIMVAVSMLYVQDALGDKNAQPGS